jgi:DNA repair protein RadC
MKLRNNKFSVLEQKISEEMILSKMISFVTGESKARDVAKKLIDEFSTLRNVLCADVYKLSTVVHDEKQVLEILDLFKSILSSILYFRIDRTDVINSRDKLIDYLKFKIGGLSTEQSRVLYLNKKNMLLADEVISEGTLDTVSYHPREIVRKALFHGSSSIIIVHNHPSGDPKASQNDLIITDKIIKACDVFGISVHDHIIISKNGYFSCLS